MPKRKWKDDTYLTKMSSSQYTDRAEMRHLYFLFAITEEIKDK